MYLAQLLVDVFAITVTGDHCASGTITKSSMLTQLLGVFVYLVQLLVIVVLTFSEDLYVDGTLTKSSMLTHFTGDLCAAGIVTKSAMLTQ